jgi:hypothetical protein
MLDPALFAEFPRPLTAYPIVDGLGDTLLTRIRVEPFNAVATGIFLVAILHTFTAARFTAFASALQERHDRRLVADGRSPSPSVAAELLHFLGEVEIVFGLWAAVLLLALTLYAGWAPARRYLNDGVNYTEPLFVVVIMTLAATRPIINAAEASLRRVARAAGGSPAAWWATILTVGPLLGSFITEPGAMTICALLLARQFYDLEPGTGLKYATLGVLFVNVSIGGTLTDFAAPPVLMVARRWQWDTVYMFTHIGWRAIVASAVSTLVYFVVFRREFRLLAAKPPVPDIDRPEEDRPIGSLLPVPAWLTAVNLVFMGWTVLNAHYPALFLGGFMFFLGFARATASYQSRIELKTPLLVGFFLAGLVIHGSLQGWWIAPVLGSLSDRALFLGATFLTMFNDNALVTYLSTLCPNLTEVLKRAVVSGAVVGGGMTVIANAPNPAGQALLSRFFRNQISPAGLAAGAALPTVVAAIVFWLI